MTVQIKKSVFEKMENLLRGDFSARLRKDISKMYVALTSMIVCGTVARTLILLFVEAYIIAWLVFLVVYLLTNWLVIFPRFIFRTLLVDEGSEDRFWLVGKCYRLRLEVWEYEEELSYLHQKPEMFYTLGEIVQDG